MQTTVFKYTPRSGGADVEMSLKCVRFERENEDIHIRGRCISERSYRIEKGNKHFYSVALFSVELLTQSKKDFVTAFIENASRRFIANEEYTGGLTTFVEVVMTSTEEVKVSGSKKFKERLFEFEELGVH